MSAAAAVCTADRAAFPKHFSGELLQLLQWLGTKWRPCPPPRDWTLKRRLQHGPRAGARWSLERSKNLLLQKTSKGARCCCSSPPQFRAMTTRSTRRYHGACDD